MLIEDGIGLTKEEQRALLECIAALETRIVELERCKHDGHIIGNEALQQITATVKKDIVSSLQPPPEG